jgi:hypothetical protein
MKSESRKSLKIIWVIYGSVLGILLSAIAYFGVVSDFNSAAIQFLSLAIAYIFAGLFSGYVSDGLIFKEIGIAGAIVTVATLFFILAFPGRIELSQTTLLVGIIGSIILTYTGAWAGENMQQESTKLKSEISTTEFRWNWVLVGFVLGFGLNVLFSVILAPIYTKDLTISFYMFLLSTFLTGGITAWYSPRITLKEPALAGILAVLVEWILIEFVLEIKISAQTLVIGLIIGFFLTLSGAFIGRKLQALKSNNQE